jgi:type IV pilus assembly protein PilQ
MTRSTRLILIGAIGVLGLFAVVCVLIISVLVRADADREPSSPVINVSASPLPEFVGTSVYASSQPKISQQVDAPNSSTMRWMLDNLVEIRAELDADRRAPKTASANAKDSKDPFSKESASLPAAPVAAPQKIIGEGDDQLRIEVHEASIRSVLQSLAKQGGVSILPSANVKGNVSLTLEGVTFDNALAALLNSSGLKARNADGVIYVGTREDIVSLDHSRDRMGTRIYRPNYVNAAELKKLLTPFITPEVGRIEVTSPSEVGIGSDSSGAGGDAYAGPDIVVIRDYEAVLYELDQMIREIDRRPLQVLIEAMILSVNLDDSNKLGVNFEVLLDRNNVRLVSGNPAASLAAINTNDGGMNIGFLDSSLAAFVNALEEIGDTNVIVTPRILCVNKHRAEIHIGEELGYVSTSQTETSTTQSVEFLEVGTQLRLRPFIASDGYIRIELHPELSSGTVVETAGFTVPNKKVTQVTTNVLVRDGCTVVLGGLISETLEASNSQVPLLGSLPFIGPVFRNQTEITKRSEIIVLLTPRIVSEPELSCNGEHAASEFHRRQAVYASHMSPIGKRYLGKKCFRKAQEAWSLGNQKAALANVSLAIHIDPLNRAAIQLREEILGGVQRGKHTVAPVDPVEPFKDINVIDDRPNSDRSLPQRPVSSVPPVSGVMSIPFVTPVSGVVPLPVVTPGTGT